MRLVNKVAVITGAASGIGRATAIVLAKEGARVVVADINNDGGKETVEGVKANGGEAIFVRTDIAVATEVENLINIARDRYGGIDILINAAAMIHRHMPIEEMDDALWDRVYAVNVKGAFYTMKYAIPFMKEKRSGAIINIGGPGKHVPRPDCSAYASSKGALLTLTREVALELAPYTIRVNTINPGGTDTPMLRKIQDEAGLDEEEREALARNMPFGRLIKPEEIAYAALFLASDEALMISGTELDVNPGRF